MVTLGGLTFFGTIAVFSRGVVQVLAIAGVIGCAALDTFLQTRTAERAEDRRGDRVGSLPAARSPHEPYETLPEKAMRWLVEGETVRYGDRRGPQ